MPVHRLGGTHRQSLVGVVPEHLPDGAGLDGIRRGRSGVRVHVPDLLRTQARVFQRQPHAARGPLALGRMASR